MSNPELVINSIIDSEGTKTDGNISIFPCSIRRYALLEKLNSPFVNPEVKFDITGIVPSAYVFATDSAKLKQYTTKDVNKLIEDAFEWAESLSVSDIPQMIEVITKQMTDVNKAAPSGGDKGETVEEGTKKN